MTPDHAWPFLSDAAHPVLSAIWAVLVHGLLSVVVLGPLLAISRHRARDALLAAAANVALDLDHFVAAGTLSLHSIETMSDRPITHSLLFAVLLSGVVLALARRPILAWATFAMFASHLLFDAAGGSERLLYPFSRLDGIPWLLFPLGLAMLTGLSGVLAAHVRKRTRRPSSAHEARPSTVSAVVHDAA